MWAVNSFLILHTHTSNTCLQTLKHIQSVYTRAMYRLMDGRRPAHKIGDEIRMEVKQTQIYIEAVAGRAKIEKKVCD